MEETPFNHVINIDTKGRFATSLLATHVWNMTNKTHGKSICRNIGTLDF